jgi:hypothetical protein
MKRIIFFVILFSLCGIIFAQNGYQEYTFGMEMDTIKSRFPNNIHEDSYYYKGLFYIIKHLYNSELTGNIPNPLTATDDEFKVLLTGNNNYTSDSDFKFLFSNNKLVGIITFFKHDDILPEIIRKYGNGNKYVFSWPGVVWLNGQRFIIWEELDFREYKYQIVTYIDANWARELCRKRMEIYRAEQQKVRSRLD